MIPFTALDLAAQRHIPHAPTLQHWLDNCGPGYQPTLRADLMGQTDRDSLADAFDANRRMQGRPERAYRC